MTMREILEKNSCWVTDKLGEQCVKDLLKQLETLINQSVQKALTKELAHWVTESNLDYELFQMRIAKRYATLKDTNK